MDDAVEYVFKIKGEYSIRTLPMERLAQYMAELAKLLGEPQKVHFVKLVESSVAIVHEVEPDAAPIVDDRVVSIAHGTADVVTLSHYRNLNKMLREDRGEGSFGIAGGAQILDFPGVKAPEPVKLSGIPQVGKIDGTIIRIGGQRDEIPVAVKSGTRLYTKCVTNKPLAKKLAKYLFEGELRLHGNGKWSRDENGVWTLQRFVISDFEELDMTPLAGVIAELRQIEGARWSDSDDLWREAIEERGDKLN